MTNLEQYLKSVGKQEEVEVKKINVVRVRNSSADEIVRVYEHWLMTSFASTSYHLILEVLENYNSKDITEFSFRLKNYETEHNFNETGLFLSALINKSSDDEFNIITEHLSEQPDWVGYMNEKKRIKIIGNAGKCTGDCMSGGYLKVEGNAGDYVGVWMSGGILEVKGNVGHFTGGGMRGGIIKIEGKLESISQFWKCGDIYEKDQLVTQGRGVLVG